MDTRAAIGIVGRDEERGALRSFVTGERGGALVVLGESGIGKTALLDEAAELAAQQGRTVVRVAGVEAEAGLDYAGLHQILYPLLGVSAELDGGAREVFETVFGQRADAPPSVLTLGIAVLALFEAAGPLVLVLDDAQWLDPASAGVCGFVARRLRGPAAMLVAGRSEVAAQWDGAALLELEPLSDAAAAELLDRRYPELPPRTRRRTLENAGGNPLALLELPTHIAAGTDDLDDEPAVPVPHKLRRIYSDRIAALDPAVRVELLRGALDPAYPLREEAPGLLEIEPASGGYVFRHPLVRAAVIGAATPEQRREAHAALAASCFDDLERRAGHLAAAATGPDDTVAALLETAAAAAIRRGGAGAAVALLTRAARLSTAEPDRSRRLGDAAFVAGHAARLDRAQRIVRAESAAEVLASAYAAFYGDGDIRDSYRRVAATIEALSRETSEPTATLTRLIDLLIAMSQYAGDAETWSRTRRLLDGLGALVTARSRLYLDTWGDVVRHGAGAAERVLREAAQPEPTPWDVTRLAVSAYHLDLAGEFRPRLQRMVDRELDTGAVASGIVMAHVIMLDQLASGEWDAAEATGLRALERATELGFELFVRQTRGYLGYLAALRGRVEQAGEARAEIESWARPRGLGFLTQLADAIGALTALSSGDYETAYGCATALTAPGEFTPYAYQAPRTLLDLVEAAVYSGRLAEARAHVRAARAARLETISPRLAILTHGAGALVADDAAALVAAAENHPAAGRFPFELARLRLAHGIRLRHSNSRTAARPYLTAAAADFDRLGAAPWAARAHAELRAIGVRAAAAEPAALTEQERRIAELAAAGLTNKEIGRQLYLSPRTVSSHLYRVFPKLGITTRAALRDALARELTGV